MIQKKQEGTVARPGNARREEGMVKRYLAWKVES